MLYLISGSDQFLINEKLSQIKEKFISKTGSDFNIETFDENAVFQKIKIALEFTNFLSPYKLIILKNYLSKGKKDDQEKLAKYLKKPFENIYLVFVEINENKKNSLSKIVVQGAKITRCNSLTYYQLIPWVKKQIELKNGQISYEAVKTLIFYIGNNLYRLQNEIEKLINYKGKDEIEVENIKNLVKPEFSPSIFELIDNIAAKNLKKSEELLCHLFETGENPLYIHTMIVYQFRNLIKIKSLVDSGLSKAEIKSQAKLHPFVVEKSLSQINNFSFSALKQIYKKLMDAEIAMKTGAIEGDLALELVVLALVK